MNSMAHIVLASASPRRRQLLATLGVVFDVRPSNVNEEALPNEHPLVTQERITLDKAERCDVADLNGGGASAPRFVIACDTTVLMDGAMLNKPADEQEARAMLETLRGRTHTVNSCVVLRDPDSGERQIAHATTDVVMRNYTDEEITTYIATGDPWDKAGGYAMQHAGFHPVQSINGCPLNVIGLPLCVLRTQMQYRLPLPDPVCDSELLKLGVHCAGRSCGS